MDSTPTEEQHDAASYKDAYLLPVKGAETGSLLPNVAYGGVYSQDREFIAKARLERQYAPITVKENKLSVPPAERWIKVSLINPDKARAATLQSFSRLEGQYIFAGYLFNHFGHFLLESLARLWFLKQYPHIPIIWLGVRGEKDISPFQHQILALLEVKNPIIVISKPTQVGELIIPDNGFQIQTEFSPAQERALAVVNAGPVVRGKKIWLSRSKVKSGRFVNDAVVERYLEADGWQIFHPEEHSLSEQIHTIKDAQHIAGYAGSAFHLLVFLKNYQGQIDLIPRGRVISQNFLTIADRKSLNQKVFGVEALKWSSRLPSWTQNYLFKNLDQVLDILDVQRPKIGPSKPFKLGAYISQLLKTYQPKSLMQVGAEGLSDFLKYDVRCKVCVAPDFGHDVRDYLNTAVCFHEMTVEQFYVSGENEHVLFDFICLTDPLNEEAFVRFVFLAQSSSHANTIWLLPTKHAMNNHSLHALWEGVQAKTVLIEDKKYLLITGMSSNA